VHELPVTQGILDVVLESAQKNGRGRVTAIELVIGDLSSIVDDSVQFYFDILSQGTNAQGAVLRFRRVHGIGRCGDCGHEFVVQIPLLPQCPRCGGLNLRVTGGREFYVDSIEVEDGSAGCQEDTECQ
jgi:hydrogenase nickel incorporation protein HypA/HybF